MTKRRIFFVGIVVILVLIVGLTGCSIPAGSQTVQETEQQKVEANQKNLMNSVPAPNLSSSLERTNIKKRLELFDDENKISYIYLVSYGKVMSFHAIKGKVSSGSKRLTTNQKLVQGDYGANGWGDFIMESPSLDGAYGSSDPYIFFWTTDNVYIQWNGEYMIADQPLKLTTPPELFREIN